MQKQLKADRIAAEGLVHVEVKDNEAAIVEINSETDFVARNEGFQELVKEIANHILDSKVETVDALMESKLSSGKTVDERMKEAISTIGEKLSIRRFSIRTKLIMMHLVHIYTWVTYWCVNCSGRYY